ncbi:30S ribosomal protein S4 [uncultured archaeon]|nr:30S ribosomal protein S4 [uncultured archaeon]
MGDPRKAHKKYSHPSHPWKSERIVQETETKKKYGLRSMKEIWRANQAIRRFRQNARKLLSLPEDQTQKERKELLDILRKSGIADAKTLDDVLALTIENLLERRLQTVVYRKGLANTIAQARQFIIHRHIKVGDRIVDMPTYIVSTEEEGKIQLVEKILAIKEAQAAMAKEAATKKAHPTAPAVEQPAPIAVETAE